MSGIATAIIGGAVVGAAASSISAKKAAKASKKAAETQAGAQMAQLEYLKEREALPMQYREAAIRQLGALYGLPEYGLPEDEIEPDVSRFVGRGLRGAPYGPSTYEPREDEMEPGVFRPLGREAFVAGLREDPFYQEQVRAGEEAVLRGAAVTGGLRAGGTSAALAGISPGILRGLYQERVSGLTGMAGLPSYAPQIAGVMGGIGETQAAGMLGAARAQQAGYQGISGAIGTGVGQYLQYKARV